MRRQLKRACAATIATAASVALAAGMTSPASAEAEQHPTSAASFAAKHRITLITGDRVVVDSKSRVVGVERAKGRDHVPFRIREARGTHS